MADNTEAQLVDALKELIAENDERNRIARSEPGYGGYPDTGGMAYARTIVNRYMDERGEIMSQHTPNDDILYVLTISGDLGEYYDQAKGEGSWDRLAPEVRRAIVADTQDALNEDPGWPDRYIAFDLGIGGGPIKSEVDTQPE
jgi:hypothetical protein